MGGKNLPAVIEKREEPVPAIVTAAGGAARFAWDEFFAGGIRNPHTRRAYLHAVRRFLAWAEGQEVALARITPGLVGQYLDGLATGTPPRPASIPTKKLHLAALKGIFDALVVRHAVLLNPAASVRAERYSVVEGKTPAIAIEQARALLGSIAVSYATEDGPQPDLVGLRDRAVIAILIYTAARVGAVAKLTRGSLTHDGHEWALRFQEKGGKQREIPVQHNLERCLLAWLDAAGLRKAPKDAPLFRSAIGKTRQLSKNAPTAGDFGRMIKRRLKAAGLPPELSPHSFRVATITDLLHQGVALEDVQQLAGHADARTTRLYDRRHKQVTRKVVEKISV
jgi:site-specific recombinase XerD